MTGKTVHTADLLRRHRPDDSPAIDTTIGTLLLDNGY